MKTHTQHPLPLLIAVCTAVITALLPVHAENPVPSIIPKYDGKPGAKDKPVKIYIFSGQSNSLGFEPAE